MIAGLLPVCCRLRLDSHSGGRGKRAAELFTPTESRSAGKHRRLQAQARKSLIDAAAVRHLLDTRGLCFERLDEKNETCPQT